MDEEEVVALAKRLNFTFEDMKQMSFVTLYNTLSAAVETDNVEQATQDDIDRFFGQEVNMATSTINIIVICVTLIVLYLLTKIDSK